MSAVREWATARLQWAPLRNGTKYAVHGMARARGRSLERRGAVPEIGNILAAGPQKAGSQWLKALFDHPLVRAHTGLMTLPQLDYQLAPPAKGFPAGTFVPGVYLSYPEFEALAKPHPLRLVYLSRDPRDMVVSGYWSAVKTHRVGHLPEVEKLRERIRTASYEDGLLAIIDSAAQLFRDMDTWVGVEDERVARFKLEDVAKDQRPVVLGMLAHTGVTLSDTDLEQVLRDVDRGTLQSKDLARRKDGESHYRVNQSGHEDVFSDVHYAAIERVAPGLIERLGYAM
ncbi:hypothetical protein ASE01_05820 [Nocardioides sp. Root190]|uniref:sulfotransferase domain-containing protein n=1 Tax=Nocardioides sp. Root190 TaxID=1736488 RepID=UPI0006FD50BB|nr:sulfotransferase domain-containing protein [Nocardioides sp. Root190]KRB77719.1 hypothetical protein ASE01_05820 [Nocardioides sp. Root190]